MYTKQGRVLPLTKYCVWNLVVLSNNVAKNTMLTNNLNTRLKSHLCCAWCISWPNNCMWYYWGNYHMTWSHQSDCPLEERMANVGAMVRVQIRYVALLSLHIVHAHMECTDEWLCTKHLQSQTHFERMGVFVGISLTASSASKVGKRMWNYQLANLFSESFPPSLPHCLLSKYWQLFPVLHYSYCHL